VAARPSSSTRNLFYRTTEAPSEFLCPIWEHRLITPPVTACLASLIQVNTEHQNVEAARVLVNEAAGGEQAKWQLTDALEG
jgi:hypothetical protein